MSSLTPRLERWCAQLGRAWGGDEAGHGAARQVFDSIIGEGTPAAAEPNAAQFLQDNGIGPDDVADELAAAPIAEPDAGAPPSPPAPARQPNVGDAPKEGRSGYFRAPDAIFEPMALGSAERLVYLALCRRSDRKAESWPGLERIAADSALSVSTVQRALKVLRVLRLIHRRRRPNRSSVYSTRPPAEWLVRPAVRSGHTDHSEISGPVTQTSGPITQTEPERSQ